jgi:hypothetical protein
MKAGFVGAAGGNGAMRDLGVDLPKGSARGGPVIDAGARLIGVAATAGPARPSAPDAIYEPALSQTLQLIRSGVARPATATVRRSAK